VFARAGGVEMATAEAAGAAVTPVRGGRVQVTAFSSPSCPEWRWRIVNYAGEVIEESHDRFPTISAAVASGTKRLVQMNVVDRSVAQPAYRTTSHLRRR